MNTPADQLDLAQGFAVALAALDTDALSKLCTEDVYWTVPGDGPVGGRIEGVEGIIAFQQVLHDHAVRTDVRQIFHGRDSLLALLHDWGEHNGRRLDADLALVLTLRDGRIAAIDGHMADVTAFAAYLG
ncbi:nuclear transport factor 2 family protein [Strepomyces sp. STD 3.1]|nr:nuclear transport factor 2 family protein [Streptomyces sp. STD 3.1]